MLFKMWRCAWALGCDCWPCTHKSFPLHDVIGHATPLFLPDRTELLRNTLCNFACIGQSGRFIPKSISYMFHETLQIRCPHGHTFAGRAVRHVREINILSNNVEINIFHNSDILCIYFKMGILGSPPGHKARRQGCKTYRFTRGIFSAGPNQPD